VPTEVPFARFARRLTLGYVVLAVVLILTVVAVSSVLAIVLYVGSLNGSVATALQRAEVLAAQYQAEGETLPEYALVIVNEFNRTRVHVFVLDEDQQMLAGIARDMPPPRRNNVSHVLGALFGLHPSIAHVPGGSIVVMPDIDDLSLFFERYLAVVVPVGGLTILLAWLYGRRITRRAIAPLADVTTSLHRIAGGDFTPAPLPDEGNVELRDLTSAYNDVAHRLTLATAERERHEQQMRQFIADAGHELRTPLTVVMGYLEMLQRGSIEDGEGVERVVATMLSESRRMRASIEKLILLARLERPAGPHVQRLDAAVLAARVADALAPIAGDGRIAVTGAASAPLDGDESELYEALKNAVENAVRYAPESPVTIDVARENGSVQIDVVDRGPGMSARELEHAFDRFFRGDARTPSGDPIEGSGLGLAIAQRAVERAGGSIDIASKPGEGTRVRFKLPTAT
jgi:two-component system, OmpR family, sensor kinase